VLRVIVRNAGPADVQAVTRDVGRPNNLEDEPSSAMPRLEISFVDGMSTSALRCLDGGCVGYAGAGVYELARHDAPRSFIEQGATWGSGAIVCTRGLRRIPFLSAAVDLASLAAGWAPLHASAWVSPEGVGVIASGWAHSGKTGALLAAYEQGARPIGDDRILLSPDGTVMVGLNRPVHAKDWHIAQLSGLRETIGSVRGAFARAGFAVASRRQGRRTTRWSKLVDRALTKARDASSVEIELSETGDDRNYRSSRPNLLLLMETHGVERVMAEPADPDSVAPRLAAHARADLIPTLRSQLAYEYAHPDTGWKGVDQAPSMAARILEQAVGGIPAFIVRHPYPCSLERLHAVTSELAASVA
jgi:hypothetical protein